MDSYTAMKRTQSARINTILNLHKFPSYEQRFFLFAICKRKATQAGLSRNRRFENNILEVYNAKAVFAAEGPLSDYERGFSVGRWLVRKRGAGVKTRAPRLSARNRRGKLINARERLPSRKRRASCDKERNEILMFTLVGHKLVLHSRR